MALCFLVNFIQYYNDMDYILIPVKDKNETDFLLNLLKKMHHKASTLSSDKMEDMAFLALLKESEKSGKGSLSKVKSHLAKIASEK
jgi:hypothetical protein